MAMEGLEGKHSAKAVVAEIIEKDGNVDDGTTANKKDQKQKSKKRKRASSQRRDWRLEQEKYYQRLLYTAQKDLRKQAKIVRTFECKKMIRKIKERKENAPDDGNKPKSLASTGESYEWMKQLDLEVVVQECLRRVGILHLDPKLDPRYQEESGKESDNGAKDPDEGKRASGEDVRKIPEEGSTSTGSSDEGRKLTELQKLPKERKALVERILKHKKMQTALENWNEQVTEYRRWSLQRQEKALGVPDFDGSSGTGGKKKKNKKKSRTDHQGVSSSISQGPKDKSQFVCLGGTRADGTDSQDIADEEMPHYGPGSFEEKKRNRPGQRARKAKAIAIEAKKTGRPRKAANSVNWRPKKQHQDSGETIEGNKSESLASASHKEREDKASSKQEELHPSWAAKKEKKAGIVQFQGTKITF